jgi:hypothetical protein
VRCHQEVSKQLVALDVNCTNVAFDSELVSLSSSLLMPAVRISILTVTTFITLTLYSLHSNSVLRLRVIVSHT